MKIQNSKFLYGVNKIQKLKLKFKTFYFLLVFLILNFLLLTLSLHHALAQSLSLSVWPPLIEVTIQPGRTVTNPYKLTNNSYVDLQITPVIYAFEAKGKTGEITLKPKEQIERFFSFDSGQKLNTPFNLSVGQTKDIVLRISIPRDATEKDYYYTLLFSTPNSSEETQTRSTSVIQLGTNILITVTQASNPPLLGKIVEFSAPVIVDSFSKINFNITLENWGKAVWKPFGQITLESLFKQTSEIPLLEQNVLAGSQRKLTIEPFRPKFPLGPYRAKLDFSLNEGGERLNTEIVVWYLPLKALAFVFILVVVLLIIKKSSSKKFSIPPEKAKDLSQSIREMSNRKQAPNKQ